MITKNFMTAGNAIFTVEIPENHRKDKPHYTYRIKAGKKNDRFPKPVLFVQILSGPDNTRDYSYLGILDSETGVVRTTAKSKLSTDSYPFRLLNRIFNRIWNEDTESISKSGFSIHHEGRCGRCGRRLTVPESVKTGIGPECAGKIN